MLACLHCLLLWDCITLQRLLLVKTHHCICFSAYGNAALKRQHWLHEASQVLVLLGVFMELAAMQGVHILAVADGCCFVMQAPQIFLSIGVSHVCLLAPSSCCMLLFTALTSLQLLLRAYLTSQEKKRLHLWASI